MHNEDTFIELYESQISFLNKILDIEYNLYSNKTKENIEKFKEIVYKKELLENYCNNLIRYNFLKKYIVINHQIQKNNEILNVIFNRIIFFNTKTLGLLEILPKEIILKIFEFLNFNEIYEFSQISIPALLLVNEYREHNVISTNNSDDIGFQKYLITKDSLLDYKKYLEINPLNIQQNNLYILDPYNYCEVTFNYI
jgi:hypothetical protein